MKRKQYIKPESQIVELVSASMLAMSVNQEKGDGWQLSNRQNVAGWDASAWSEAEADE